MAPSDAPGKITQMRSGMNLQYLPIVVCSDTKQTAPDGLEPMG